jgi:predicted nuclease of predicted toxin-antitoxin system
LRVLLDQNAPLGLRKHLKEHDVVTARYMGWEGASNGDLIAAAEEHGFDILVTTDKNLQYQQNMTGRRIAIVVLETNHWATIKQDPARVVDAVNGCAPGSFVEVAFDRPAPRGKGSGPQFDL